MGNVEILRSLQEITEQRGIQTYQADQPIMETEPVGHQGQEWQDAARKRSKEKVD